VAANGDRQIKSALEFALSLPLIDMMTFMQSARTAAAKSEDVQPPIRVGSVLLQLLDAMQEGLRNDWLRWESAPADVRRR
jgi:hypothetical protein